MSADASLRGQALSILVRAPYCAIFSLALARGARRALLFPLVLIVTGQASAGQPEREELSRWLPMAGIGFSLQYQEFDSSGSSTLGYAAQQTSTVFSQSFDVDATLLTPALTAGGGAPRLFARTSLEIPISGSQPVLQETESFSPLDGRTPMFCPIGGPLNKSSCDQSISSTFSSELAWTAGLGVAFDLPFGQLPYRLWASVDYFGQLAEVSGVAVRSDRTSGTTPGTTGQIVEEFEIASTVTTTAIHALGPRLDLSIGLVRLQGWTLSAFLKGAVYWVVSRDDVRFGGSNGSGTAMFDVVQTSPLAQFGGGVRFVWNGARGASD